MSNMQPSLLRLPQSLWARVLLLLMGLSIFFNTQLALYWIIIGIVGLICIANLIEGQQAQINHLRMQIEQRHQQENLLRNHQPPKASSLSTQDELSLDVTALHSMSENPPAIDNLTHITNAENTTVQVNHALSENEEKSSWHTLKQENSLWNAVLHWFKGGNSIVRIAVVILLIGVVLLLRFASEYWQFSLSVKMGGIAVAGLALTALGYALRHKRFDYAVSVQGAGLGIVFLVLFSSYHLAVVSSITLSYVALSILLATTLCLAIRQNTVILAFIALGCGFVAPFVLNTGSQNISALMGYYCVLNLALAVIAWFKPWRILNTVALLMTFGIGGFAIWFNAQSEQYTQIAIWIWVIFALYLFVSIRYSQLIVELNIPFKEIPYVDTTLIFATPFMAFSLYAGVVDSSGYALSIASGILAAVYVLIGCVLHQKQQQLSILAQCFYGLGLVFSALILPFALDSYWTSVGWAIHGVVVLWLGWRYTIVNARYFGVMLLLASGVATFVSAVFEQQSVVFANSVLMLSYAVAAYCCYYSYDKKSTSLQPVLQIISYAFIFISLAFLAPYAYKQIISGWFDRIQYGHGVAILLWYLILTTAYWLKERTFHSEWKLVTLVVLLTSIFGLNGILATFDLGNYYFLGLELSSAPQQKTELIFSALLWCMSFFIYMRCMPKDFTTLTPRLNKIINQALMMLALLVLALLGSIWATAPVPKALLVVLPILFLIATLKLKSLAFLHVFWQGNWGVITLAVLWLWWVSLTDVGQLSFGYFPVLSPVDICSFAVVMLIAIAIKPYLATTVRKQQLLNTLLLLSSGLLVMSSVLLRTLYHYADLPYWSSAAWQNSTVQMGLTILWASVALLLTTLASKKAWRAIWMLGIAVLSLVIVKLIFLDLSHNHTLTRIISFIASGLIMLVIGYFSPLPPAQKEKLDEAKE